MSADENPSSSKHQYSKVVDEYRRELKKIRRLTNALDTKFTLPGGVKLGFDSIIGLVPGVGDVSSAAFSLWIILKAKRLGVSKSDLGKMIGYTTIDTIVGAIPIVGDVFDIVYKSNTKNMALIERHVEKAVEKAKTDAIR